MQSGAHVRHAPYTSSNPYFAAVSLISGSSSFSSKATYTLLVREPGRHSFWRAATARSKYSCWKQGPTGDALTETNRRPTHVQMSPNNLNRNSTSFALLFVSPPNMDRDVVVIDETVALHKARNLHQYPPPWAEHVIHQRCAPRRQLLFGCTVFYRYPGRIPERKLHALPSFWADTLGS